jgi:hypothetical protein
MAEELEQEEYEEVRKRRSSGISNLVKNLSNWHFVVVVALIVIVLFMIKDEGMSGQAWIMLIAVILFVIFFSKKAEQTRLISEDVAKRIAVESIENKKEEWHLSPDVDVTPTNYCVLQYRSGEPFKWHVGVKIESKLGRILYWRVIIHPYEGIVIGIVREPTGFEGDEHEVKDVVVVYPNWVEAEK